MASIHVSDPFELSARPLRGRLRNRSPGYIDVSLDEELSWKGDVCTRLVARTAAPQAWYGCVDDADPAGVVARWRGGTLALRGDLHP